MGLDLGRGLRDLADATRSDVHLPVADLTRRMHRRRARQHTVTAAVGVGAAGAVAFGVTQVPWRPPTTTLSGDWPAAFAACGQPLPELDEPDFGLERLELVAAGPQEITAGDRWSGTLTTSLSELLVLPALPPITVSQPAVVLTRPGSDVVVAVGMADADDPVWEPALVHGESVTGDLDVRLVSCAPALRDVEATAENEVLRAGEYTVWVQQDATAQWTSGPLASTDKQVLVLAASPLPLVVIEAGAPVPSPEPSDEPTAGPLPGLDPTAAFPACGAAVGDVVVDSTFQPLRIAPDIETVTWQSGSMNELVVSATVGSSGGYSVIANAPTSATLVLSQDGVVVGALPEVGDVDVLDLTSDETEVLDAVGLTTRCDTGEPLPAGAYDVHTVLSAYLKEVTSAEGEVQPIGTPDGLAPEALVVSEPTRVTVTAGRAAPDAWTCGAGWVLDATSETDAAMAGLVVDAPDDLGFGDTGEPSDARLTFPVTLSNTSDRDIAGRVSVPEVVLFGEDSFAVGTGRATAPDPGEVVVPAGGSIELRATSTLRDCETGDPLPAGQYRVAATVTLTPADGGEPLAATGGTWGVVLD